LVKTLHVSDNISVRQHTAIGIGDTGYADCLLAGSGWFHNLYDLYLLLCVQC